MAEYDGTISCAPEGYVKYKDSYDVHQLQSPSDMFILSNWLHNDMSYFVTAHHLYVNYSKQKIKTAVVVQPSDAIYMQCL